MMYRQGDVLLMRVDTVPFARRRDPDERGRLIVARGEATGHVHAIESPLAELFENNHGELYLEVSAGLGGPVRLVHEEHDPVTLPPGSYRIIRQVEYDPLERRQRNVND